MPSCKKCHAELPPGANFCHKCGASVALERKRKARGNGMGTVYKRGKTWTALKVVGFLPLEDGRTKRITSSKGGFRTKKEALEYLPKLDGAERKRKSLSWAAMYETWQPTHRAGKSTMDCYAAAENYFRPIWLLPFDQIDIDDLQDCLDDCPKGKRTRENMKALAGLLYKYAIPRHMATLNLAQYLIVGGGDANAKTALPDYALEALRCAVGHVWGADYVISQCYLGFRPSELLALDAKDYDRKERAFTGGAKTDAGRDRVVTVSPKIQPIIDHLTKDKIAGPVFCGPGGQPMSIEQYRAMFYRVLDECGIENPMDGPEGAKRHRYTPHSCRHTFATLMKRVPGADKDKLELIGHTSAEMLRHYQDINFEDLRRVTNAI